MRPVAAAFACRQICRVNLHLLVTPLRRMHVLEVQRLLCAARAGCPPRDTPRRPRRKMLRRRAAASPSAVWYSSRKWPPQDSLRSSASRHISSANSKKSATRPAFSSDWFNSSPVPSTFTSRQNCSRSAGISSSACFRPVGGARHAAIFPQQLAQLAVEGIHRARALDFQQALGQAGDLLFPPRLNAGWPVSTFSSLAVASNRRWCWAGRNSRPPGPA